MGTLQVGGTTLGVKNTVTNKVDLSNVGDITKESLPMYACRVWVNFDGTDTSSANPLSFTNTNATNHGDSNSSGETLCAIRGSGNVSKVVRNDTGDYTITFTTAMPDTNYATMAMVLNDTYGDESDTSFRGIQTYKNSVAQGSIRILSKFVNPNNSGEEDEDGVFVAVFR